MGIYQLIFPIHTLCFALSVGGIQTAISRFTAARAALKDEQGARDIFVLSGALSTVIALGVSVILYQNASWFAVHILLEERCTPLLRLMAFSIPMGTLHSCGKRLLLRQKKNVCSRRLSASGTVCQSGRFLRHVPGLNGPGPSCHSHAGRGGSFRRGAGLYDFFSASSSSGTTKNMDTV